MISLSPFDNEGPPPSDPLDAYNKLRSELDEETIARMHLAENAVTAKENMATDQITQVVRHHLEPCVPDWACHNIGLYLSRSGLYTQEQMEADPATMFIFQNEEKFEFHEIKLPFVRWFLDRERSRFRQHNTLRIQALSPEKFRELEKAADFMARLLKSADVPDKIPMEEFDVARATFAHFARQFPPAPIADDDWQMMATILGVLLEGATKNFEGQHWLHNPMTRSVSEALMARQLSRQWDSDKITFKEVVDKLREVETANSKAVLEQLCRLLSLQLHSDMMPDIVPTLDGVLADYQSIGYMNSWDGSPPELLQKARKKFLPVTRVHVSGTGNQEVWACHHLRFYYRVDCS